jgi:DNA-binding MarR family transcriptional regulator
LAKHSLRLLFCRLAALHFSFHLSRLRWKNATNFLRGLRNGNERLAGIRLPPCNIQNEFRGSRATTKTASLEQKPSNDNRPVFTHPGLTPSQYNILRILRGEGQPLPSLEIAARTITVVPGITGLIDRLEESGFVARERCAKDRRVVYVGLTANGQKTLAVLDEPLDELHKRVIGHLTQTELKELVRLLEKAREGLGSTEGE